MNVARVVMETIRDLGGTHFFCLPGRAVYPLLDEMARVPELRYVNALHEFSLTAAADGYARASGEVAFLGLYMSTGVMNATSALYMAHRDKIPMVVIATQTESWAVGANARAESAGILDLVRPVTKWAWQPPTAERVQEALLRAHAIATTPPCGPAFVAIPVDFFTVDVPRLPNPAGARPRTTTAATTGLDELAGWIRDAHQPVFVVGGEAVSSGAAAAAVTLAARLDASVLAEPEPSFMPSDTLSANYCGELTPSCTLLADADLVLHIGVNTLEREHTPVLTKGRAKRHVYIGTDEKKIHEAITYDAVVVGSIPATVAGLALAIGPSTRPPAAMRATWTAERDRLVGASDDALPLTVPAIAVTLRERLPIDAVIVEHATTAASVFRRTFHVPSSEHYIAASGSNQGWGGAAAVGVKLARRAVPVVAVIGDGGFMFSPQSVYTAVRFDAPVIYVVLNNGGWASMDASVRRDAPAIAEAGIDLGYSWSIDVAGVAAALGAETAVANTRAEFIAALDAALISGRTSFISVTSRRVNAGK